MNRLLAPISIMLAVILLVVNFPASAVDRTFQIGTPPISAADR
jgi:hypothetical protein